MSMLTSACGECACLPSMRGSSIQSTISTVGVSLIVVSHPSGFIDPTAVPHGGFGFREFCRTIQRHIPTSWSFQQTETSSPLSQTHRGAFCNLIAPFRFECRQEIVWS